MNFSSSARYFTPGSEKVAESDPHDLYKYTLYTGDHTIEVEAGDCCYWVSDDLGAAHLSRGPATIESSQWAVVVRGYAPDTSTTAFESGTNLPYMNGLSTRQVFPPQREGDPTLQLMHIPYETAEHDHHIHSTVRVIFVLDGEATCTVGVGKSHRVMNVKRGGAIIIGKMCPHHFETSDEELTILSLHVFSSTGGEFNHPMMAGTISTNK